MRQRADICRFPVFLFLSVLLLGTPLSAESTPSPPDIHPAMTPSSVTPAASDGRFRMNRYFQTCKNKANEIEAVLGALYKESVAATAGDKSKQQANFLKKLNDRYPGATFDGALGTVPFLTNFTARFNHSLKVESISK